MVVYQAVKQTDFSFPRHMADDILHFSLPKFPHKDPNQRGIAPTSRALVAKA